MLPKFHMIRDTQTTSCGIVVAFLIDIITKEAIELRMRFKKEGKRNGHSERQDGGVVKRLVV